MTSLEMMLFIFGMVLLVPLGIFFMIVTFLSFLYGEPFMGIGALVLFSACSGGVYYLVKHYHE